MSGLAIGMGLGLAALASGGGFTPCVVWEQGPEQTASSTGVAVYHEEMQVVVAVRYGNGFEQLWFDGVNLIPFVPATTPRLPTNPNGFRAAMVYDSHRALTTLFGADAVWTFNGLNWTEGPALPGAGLFNAGAAFDSWRGKSVIFGGSNGGIVDTTLEFDGGGLEVVSPPVSPPARQRHAMAFDARRGVTVMFGGTGSGLTIFDDLWEYDGLTWTQIPNAPFWPEARARHAMVFDPRRGVVAMYGGVTSTSPNTRDWWEWNGEVWTRRFSDEAAAPLTSNHQLVSFDARGELVAIWGTFAQVWAASTPSAPWVSEHPQSQSASIGETVTFAVGVGDAGPYSYRWLKNGATMPGEVGPNLVLTSVDESDAAVYECVVTRANFDASCVQTAAGPAALTVGPACIEDVNSDGSVNFADLNAVISVFNTACP